MDIIDFANIPCTLGALEYLRKSDIGLNDLCIQAAFGSIRSTGKDRVLEALKDGAMKYRRYNKLAAERELLAYPISRIIVSCIFGVDKLIIKWLSPYFPTTFYGI